MAYVRSSLVDHKQWNSNANENDLKLININDFDIEGQKNERRKSENHKNQKNQKPLVIFTFNLSFLSSIFRYLVLAFGMFFFMCLYGYFQELVVYGWFNRKLSLFCTFLHFLGCSFFAQLQFNYAGKSVQQTKNEIEINSHSLQGLSPNSHISEKIHSLSSILLISNNNANNDKTFRGKFSSIFSFFRSVFIKLQVRSCRHYFVLSLLFYFLFLFFFFSLQLILFCL